MRLCILILVVGAVLCRGGYVVAQNDFDTLNARGMKLYEEGDYEAAIKPLERALKLREASLGSDSVTTSTSVTRLANAYYSLSRYADAEPLYKRALEIVEKARGADDPSNATVVSNLAGVYEKQSRFALAEPLFIRALAMREGALKPNDPGIATDLHRLGEMYSRQGRYGEAEPLLQRALSIRAASLDRSAASTLRALVTVYIRQARYEEAEPLVKQSLTIQESLLGRDHPEVAWTLDDLAYLYYRQNRFDEAEALCKRAIKILEDSFGRDSADVGAPLTTLAHMYLDRGREADAVAIYERVLKADEAAFGGQSLEVAESLSNLAICYYQQGRLADAGSLLKRSFSIYERAHGLNHPDTAYSLFLSAQNEAARGGYLEAATVIDRAGRAARRLVADVLPSLTTAEQANFMEVLYEPLIDKSLSLSFQRRFEQQEKATIATLSAGWLANRKGVTQEAVAQQMVLARNSEEPATKAAVESLERVRSELARLAQAVPDAEETDAFQANLAKLQAAEKELIHEIGGQLAAIERDEPWVELDEIRANIPAGSVLVDIARFEDYDFEKRERTGLFHYAAWIVPPADGGEVTIVDVGPADKIDSLVADYRAGIEAVSGPDGFARGQFTLEGELRKVAWPVTEAVLKPILAALEQQELSADELILSPDGQLWLLPWQALPMSDADDAAYAIEEFAIRTVNSSRDLVPLPAAALPRTGSTQGPIIFADPAFDAKPPASDKEPVTRGLAPAGRLLPQVYRLPATREEARASAIALQQIFSRTPKAFTGTAASEETLKREVVRPPALVLATHGYVLPDQELKSESSSSLPGSGARTAPPLSTAGEPIEDPLLRCGLLLAGANITAAGETLPGEDGILTGAEIVGLDLQGTDLVVLSACQTGVGEVNTGEGVAGLRQAFQIAGARSVVATLWSVPDLESGQIMQTFYGNVAEGLPPSKALREAQLAFIKSRREDRNYEAAHPYFWAAYGVTGGRESTGTRTGRNESTRAQNAPRSRGVLGPPAVTADSPPSINPAKPDASAMRVSVTTDERTRLRAPGDVIENSLGMKLVVIPAGEFQMGSDEYEIEQPIHSVKISKPFLMGQTEVTQEQFAAVMGSRPWSGKDSVIEGPTVSASYVSWEEAAEFCRKLTARERAAGRLTATQTYRLPTEAEWEYACRASTTTKWHFGNDESLLERFDWYRSNAMDVGDYYAHQVGKKAANPWLLYDMHGNVHEWCSDWFDDAYYSQSPVVDPQGPSQDGEFRVIRGGSWATFAIYGRSANRSIGSPTEDRGHNYGFRVVCEIESFPHDELGDRLAPASGLLPAVRVRREPASEYDYRPPGFR